MDVVTKVLSVCGIMMALSSCGTREDYATATGKRLFPFQSVSMSRLVLTKVDPGKIKLKDAGAIRVYTYAIKVNSKYTSRGYLFEGPKDEREKSGNAILFGHWLGGISGVDTSEWEFFAEAASYAREGNVCVIPLGHHPWIESSTGTAEDVPLVIDQVNDYRLGLDIAFSRFKTKPPKAMIIGHDYGAMFSILTAAADSRIGAAVIMAPVSCFYYWNRIFHSIPEGQILDAYKEAMLPYEPITLIKELSIPLLFQYGESDQFVSKGDALSLIDAAIASPMEAQWYKVTHNLTRYPLVTAERKKWVGSQFERWNASRGI